MAHGVSVLLTERGHNATLWSPSSRIIPKKIVVNGYVESRNHVTKIASSAKELADNSDVIFFALPANGHKSTMDELASHITGSHQIIISSHMSFAAVYLKELLVAKKQDFVISAWNTTALTAKLIKPTSLHVSSIRANVEMVTLPASKGKESLKLCTELFPNNFIPKESILDITFSNLNPQVHMGMALCNITRIEQGEEWCQRQNVTPAVGRLIEALDRERVIIAAAYGRNVKTIIQNYGGEGKKEQTVAKINHSLHLKRRVWGPKTLQSRYVLEDVPYGLLVTTKLAQLAKIQAPLHESGVNIFSALYGRDLGLENKILDTLDIAQYQSECNA
jgi:opine dehydrogenase